MHQIKLLLWSASLFALGIIAPECYAQTYTFETIAGGTQGSNNGVAAAQFSYPAGIAVGPSGDAYVADQLNNSIRKLTPHGTNWIVTTIAGGTRGSQDGTNSTAEFSGPTDLVIDASSNIYVSDQFNYTIRKISPAGTNWVVSTIAGQVGVSGASNGVNTSAQFFNPTGLAMDSSGNIFVADEFNNAVRELTQSGTNWIVNTVAGGTSGHLDGVNTNAQFFKPSGVAVDNSDRIFVADQFNNEIRLITPSGSNWVVTTIAGQLIAGASNGLGTNSQFTSPVGVTVDTNGNVFVADLFNNAIRELTPSGSNWLVSTVGGGTQGFTNGIGTNAQFFLPNSVTTDSHSDLFVADSGNNAIREGLSSLAPPLVGNLMVTITPTNAVIAGAEWQLDGGTFQISGTTLSNLTPGRHTITFSNVSGFTTPADQLPVITAYQTTVVIGNYPTAIPNAGSLQVLIFPWLASHGDAQWQVDGGAFHTNGEIVADLSVGSHDLTFAPIAGWTTPANQTVTIANSETTLGIGTYIQNLSPTFILTVSAVPASEGTVSGGGTFPAGSVQNVTATPNSGFEFIGWAGQGTGTNNPLAAAVYTNLLLTAYFAPAGNLSLILVTNGNGTITPNWNNKTLIKGRKYSLRAIPKSASVFSNWTGSLTTNKASLTVQMETSMVLQANFVPNPFLPVKGIYDGLFMTTNGVSEATAGMLNGFVVGPNGTYSGALLINGARRGISGTFNLSGEATNHINRPAAQGGPLAATLILDWSSNPPQVTGTVSGTNWVANLTADRGTNTVPSAEFTMLIPPDTNNAPPNSSPGGYGFVSITNFVATSRNPAAAIAHLSGSLADGTLFNETVPVSKDGYVPLYANLYGGKGLVLGWINLTLTNQAGVGLAWIHPQRTSGLYEMGFTNVYLTNQIQLSQWSNAPAIYGLLTNLSVSPTPTDTNALVTYPVAIDSTGKITGDGLTGTMNTRTGLFRIIVGTGASSMHANGAILLNSTNGGGYFLTHTNAQSVQLSK